MTYDVHAVRSHFPALTTGIAHFDGPGGTQTPRPVGEAVAATLTGPLSNRGRGSLSERNADDAVTGFRQAIGDLLNVDPAGVVYGRSATQLTYDFSRHLSRGWGPGDEVVVTRLDHDSNIRPWVQAAERTGATVRWVDFDPATGELSADAIGAVVGERTRLVAVTAASNLIGTRPPITAIARLVHAAGALLFVDGVHHTAHASVDLETLGADFYTCSPYKFFGPHCGVLAARPSLLETIRPDKLLPSTDAVPERFEFGTLPYELMAGTTAAVDFLAVLGEPSGGSTRDTSRRQRLLASSMTVEEYERDLRRQLEDGIADIPGTTVHSRAAERTPTLLVTFEGRDAAAISRALGESQVLAPAGSFYALEASRHLGLGDTGGLRVGLAPYTTADEVARLLQALREAVRA